MGRRGGRSMPVRSPRRRRQLAPVFERFPVVPRVKDLPRRAALELADDSVLGHEVDEPGRAAVADAERSLEQRARAAPLPDDDLDRGFVKLVAFLERSTPILTSGTAADL